MIGIYLNPEECDFVSKILCDKLAFYCSVLSTSAMIEEMDYIKSLLSKLDYRNLEVNKPVVSFK